jgi:hypothetical protein
MRYIMYITSASLIIPSWHTMTPRQRCFEAIALRDGISHVFDAHSISWERFELAHLKDDPHKPRLNIFARIFVPSSSWHHVDSAIYKESLLENLVYYVTSFSIAYLNVTLCLR